MSSLDRALKILYTVSQRGEARVTDMARELDMDKGTVSRLSKTLAHWGLLEQNEKSLAYQLGPSAAWLGARYLAHQDIRQLARPLLVELSRSTDRTVGLVMLSHRKGVLIDKVDGSNWIGIRADIGEQMPLVYRASCKAILAYLPEQEILEILEESPQLLPSGRDINRTDRLEELAVVRSRGYAISQEEVDKGVTGIGAPVFGADGNVVAAISVATTAETVKNVQSELELAKTVCETAEAISRKLGFR